MSIKRVVLRDICEAILEVEEMIANPDYRVELEDGGPCRAFPRLAIGVNDSKKKLGDTAIITVRAVASLMIDRGAVMAGALERLRKRKAAIEAELLGEGGDIGRN